MQPGRRLRSSRMSACANASRPKTQRLAVKVDVDTERGVRDGVIPLAEACRRRGAPAVFLFSLGPDNMGRSIRRVFQPGFLKKVMRSRVVSNYGLGTLFNGVLWPGPRLGRRFEGVMRQVRDSGLAAGVHCYDHYRWQNYIHQLDLEETRREFQRACDEFERVFGAAPRVAGAPGWQCTDRSLAAYDQAGLACASDSRGVSPFRPRVNGRVFRVVQVPTTLPTLDEVLGDPSLPEDRLVDHYLGLMQRGGDHVLTVHAELEGLRYLGFFERLLERAAEAGFEFAPLETLGAGPAPVCELVQGTIPGRSGKLAVQGAADAA